MKFFAYTRGFKNDYRWSSPPALPFNEYLKENGIVIYRNANGNFSVYLCSEIADKTDYQQRRISAAVLIDGCGESKAKGFAYWALQSFGNYSLELERCIKHAGTDSWELDEKAIRQFVDSITEVETTGKPLIGRTENANTVENRQTLMRELQCYDFSSESGLKLCIDGGMKSGEKLTEIRSQVQRYLTANASLKILEDKKHLRIFDYIKKFDKYTLPVLLFLSGLVAGLLFAGNDKEQVNFDSLQEQVKTLDRKLESVDQKINTIKADLLQKLEQLNEKLQKANEVLPIPEQRVPPLDRKPLSS
jgi:hypothetical protein